MGLFDFPQVGCADSRGLCIFIDFQNFPPGFREILRGQFFKASEGSGYKFARSVSFYGPEGFYRFSQGVDIFPDVQVLIATHGDILA
jgi:hypothetical protein